MQSSENSKNARNFRPTLSGFGFQLRTLWREVCCHGNSNGFATTTELLEEIAGGDSAALEQLLELHRPYLNRLVGMRIVPALNARIDVSDAVQEVQFAIAHEIQHVGPVTGVSFSSDGMLMATCGADGAVRLWPAASLKEADWHEPHRPALRIDGYGCVGNGLYSLTMPHMLALLTG